VTRFLLLAAVVLASPAIAVRASAQQQAVLEAAQVFLDCQTFFCDFDHIRREITFVN
jgi:hypothetical protein